MELATRLVTLIAVMITLGVLLAGCDKTGQITLTETVPVVTNIEPAPKPALPRECKPLAMQPPARVAKVAGDKTPPEATERALATNIQRMNANSLAHRRCYCWQAATVASDSDKQEALPECEGIPPPTPAATPATPKASVAEVKK